MRHSTAQCNTAQFLLRPQTITAARTFGAVRIDAFDADLLLSYLLKKDRPFLIAHGNEPLSFGAKARFLFLLFKRKHGVPVAYLTGTKEFYGLSFTVNKHTLVPRPETELMVETALAEIKKYRERHTACTLIDIGTGSGCIPIAIQKNLSENIHTVAVDISKEALAIANKNAKQHNADVTFLHGSLLDPIRRHNIVKENTHIVITANLPYLSDKQFNEEPSIQQEPKSALVAPNDGLLFYEVLTRQIAEFCSKSNCTVSVLYEIDPSQTHALQDIIHEELPGASVSILKDYCGNDRVVLFSTPKE